MAHYQSGRPISYKDWAHWLELSTQVARAGWVRDVETPEVRVEESMGDGGGFSRQVAVESTAAGRG